VKKIYLVAMLLVFSEVTVISQQRSRGWMDVKTLLASSDSYRSKVVKKIGVDKGEWVLGLMSVLCDDCDKAALKLNKRRDVKNIVVVVAAPQKAASEWKKRLNLRYRVVSVSDREFEDLGAVMLPTLVLIRDGKAVGVREDVPLELEQRGAA
jgi:hypothetical protein